jgi:hypothetical protein
MKYDLVRPCPHCPFRTDGDGYLRAERAQEIATDLANGAPFGCHQTTVDDGYGDLTHGPNTQFCAGALIALENMEQPNQAMRIAERLNIYDPSKLDMDAPVGTLLDFQRRHTDEEELYQECCSVCGPECEAPAGYLEGNVPVYNVIDFEVPSCPDCGETVCESCTCWCQEDDEEYE